FSRDWSSDVCSSDLRGRWAVTDRESQMVVIERDASGKPTVWCDPEIADLVRALNAGGIRTVASCSGHGHRPGNIALADGRELIRSEEHTSELQSREN